MALITIRPTKRQAQLEALRALARKIRLEAKLKFELGKLFRIIRRKVEASIRRGESVPHTNDFQKRLERILTVNVRRTSREFNDPVATIREDDDTTKSINDGIETKQTGDDIADRENPTGAKRDINAIIATFLASLVTSTSQDVLTTLSDDMNTAVMNATAQEESERQPTLIDEPGAPPSRSKIARIAGVLLAKKAIGRIKNIATTVTAQAAEGAKQAARAVVTQHEDVETPVAQKSWVTVGDDKVRETHVDADGQQQAVDVPFDLAGGQLMFPTDGSLGADVSEIANCRCSSPPIFFNPVGLD